MKEPDPISPETLWRINIIEGMIKEDRESTIEDYLKLMDELELIANTKNYRNGKIYRGNDNPGRQVPG